MSSRFEVAPEETRDFVEAVIRDGEEFRRLVGVPIAVLFDLKRRASQGRVVYGQIKTLPEAMQILANGKLGRDPWEYVLFLDKAIWLRAEEPLRRKMIQHELRHCQIIRTETGDVKYRTCGHDHELFERDLDPDRSIPAWPDDLANIAEVAYDEKGKARYFDPNQKELFGAETISKIPPQSSQEAAGDTNSATQGVEAEENDQAPSGALDPDRMVRVRFAPHGKKTRVIPADDVGVWPTINVLGQAWIKAEEKNRSIVAVEEL